MTRINVKIKAGQETELNGAGPNIPESAMQALEAKLDALQNGDILILAGSIPASLAQTTYEPVSYTHLDVYKRQLLWLPPLFPCAWLTAVTT